MYLEYFWILEYQIKSIFLHFKMLFQNLQTTSVFPNYILFILVCILCVNENPIEIVRQHTIN
jgi:hypothetical protein